MTDVERVPAKIPVQVPVRTIGSYRGEAGRLVRGLKFAGDRRAVGHLGVGLAGLVPDVVTWLPTTAARRGRRGADQARVLARAIGRALRGMGDGSSGRVPARHLLLRAPGIGQTERSGAERHRGPVLRARPGTVPSGACVLLVDDAITTGATMDAAVVAFQ